MKISKASELTGLSKRAIRLYIDEGLISPESKVNGYYDFSSIDIKKLYNIKKIRDIGISIKNTKALFEYPQMSTYIISLHKNDLKKQIELLNKQYNCADRLLKESIKKPYEDFEKCLEGIDDVEDFDDPDRDIDEPDAEAMLSTIFNVFKVDREMDEYHMFLWERLKKCVIEDNSVYLKKLRNYQFSRSNKISINALRESLDYLCSGYQSIASLGPPDFSGFVSDRCVLVKKNLEDPLWVKSWHYDTDTSAHEIYALFNDKIVLIMEQLSPMFAKYQKNTLELVKLFYDHYKSEKGRELKRLLDVKLGNTFDPTDDNDLIRLFFSRPKGFGYA